MDLLLAVNLCVVVLIIFKKIGTLVKIYSLRVLSDKNTSLLVFLLLYQKTVVALIMVTFLINCLAFAYQLLIPCMWIVHFLNYHHIML